MKGFLIISILLIGIGVFVTRGLWPNRHDPRIRRLLWVNWTLIALAVLTGIIVTLTNTAFFALFLWEKISVAAERSGFPLLLAKATASLLLLPAIAAIYFAFSMTSWKRYLGVGLLSGMAFCFFLLQYLYHGYGVPFTTSGISTAGYTITVRDNRVSVCDAPGATDQRTGLPCLPMTPEVLAYLEEAKAKEAPLKVENPTEFFRLVDGKPKIWVCRPSPEKYYFAAIPMNAAHAPASSAA